MIRTSESASALTGTLAPKTGIRVPGRDSSMLIFQVAIFVSVLGIGSGNAAGAEGNLPRQLLWGGMAAFACVRLIRDRWVEQGCHSYGGPLLWAFVALAFCSTTWSATPAATLKRSLLLAFIIVICASALGGKNIHPRAFSTALRTPIAIFVLLSIFAITVTPALGITPLGWRGIAAHKNEFGQVIGLAILFALYAIALPGGSRVLLKSIVVIGLAVILMFSESATATIAVVGAILTSSALMISTFVRLAGSWRPMIIAGLLLAVIAIGLGALFGSLPTPNDIYIGLLATFDKSTTFTGRMGIWQLILNESIYHSPWIGSGYGGFWVGLDSISGYFARKGAGLYPGQSHNGYIDIYNDLGYIGLGLALAVIASHAYRIARLLISQHQEARFHFALLIFVLVINIGESTLFRTTQFLSVVLVASLIRVVALARFTPAVVALAPPRGAPV
jgi:exopolysaccharide production protein ExoQ